MWAYEPGQREASVGFLEAFDVAVYVGGTNLLPTLTGLVRQKENAAVAHAAFLALDRLAISAPLTTLGALGAGSEAMVGREQTLANYFARADVGEPGQRALVESYLLDSRRRGAELAAFAGVFPNANYMVSDNLLTTTITPDHATLAQRDRAALQVVKEWQADPRFAKLQPHLDTMRHRLETFVLQAP